jgi:hypothetical protein
MIPFKPAKKISSPLVDGRKKGRKGKEWVNDLFSTRQDYTNGFIYNSRLQQVMQETNETVSRRKHYGNQVNKAEEEENRREQIHKQLLMITNVEVEAQRDYLLAVRSAIENKDLHQRIIVDTDFVGTLARMKMKNQRSSDGGDLIVAVLCSEVFGLACHSEEKNVREFLLKLGGTKLILDFAEDAVRRTRGYSTRTLQLIGIAASALVNLSTLERAPHAFARAQALNKLQSWKRTTKHMHVAECFGNVLFNIARSTPRSHTTYWLDALMSIVSAEYVSNDGTEEESRHLCLQMSQILVRVMEVKGVPSTITKGRIKIIDHTLNILEKTEKLWKLNQYDQWGALLEALCGIVYLVTCSTEAIANVLGSCDPAEERLMVLIAQLTRIGFTVGNNLRFNIHGTCMAAIGNVARIQRFRVFLVQNGAVEMIDHVMSSAVSHNEPHHVALCVITLRSLASDNESNTRVVKLGGLKSLLKALKFANSSAESHNHMYSAMFRIEVLAASCICGMMSCSDIGDLVKVIGNDVQRILQEMLSQRDMLLKRHPELLGPFVTMLRNMSCTSVGLKIYSRLRGLAKTLTGMSKLIPIPTICTVEINRFNHNHHDEVEEVEEHRVSDDDNGDNDNNSEISIQNNGENSEKEDIKDMKNKLPSPLLLREKKTRWHPVWGPDAKGKLGGPKDDDTVVDADGNVLRNPEALERDYMQMRVSIAATLFNMSTLKRCCTHQIAKPHMIRYFMAIMQGDNGDGTFDHQKEYPTMHRVRELTVATLLEISRIFKSAGQQYSELGVVNLLVKLAVEKFDKKSLIASIKSVTENKAQQEEHRAALNTSILAVSTMCALTSLDCNAEVLIRHQVPEALLAAGSRAASPQPIRLRCAVALNNLVYHHPFIFASEVIILKTDRRLIRRNAKQTSQILRLPGAFKLPLKKSKSSLLVNGESSRAKSINASMFLSMVGDVDAAVRNYAASAVCHLTMREEISHKWLVRSGAVHQILLTGLVRASRDEQETRNCGILAFIRLCSKAGRKWLRRRPFSTPRVVWAATSMVKDGDYHKKSPFQKFDDSGEFRELGMVLLLYLSATPHGRVLVGNGSTMEVIVDTALKCVSRKNAKPRNANTLLRLCVIALVNLCCGIGSGVLNSPRDEKGQLRRLDDVGSADAYNSELTRRNGIFEVVASRNLVEKIVMLVYQCGFQKLKVELGSVLCSFVLADQIPFDMVEEAGVIPCILELANIDPKANTSGVDIEHWTALQEHATIAAFHISLLSRLTRDYMVRAATHGCIQLCLLPIDTYTFTNRAKDLALRSLETFSREPSLRPLLLSYGLLKFVVDLIQQHQGPVILHRRSMIISRIIRLITRRFPRSVTLKIKEEPKDEVSVDQLDSLFGQKDDTKESSSEDEAENVKESKNEKKMENQKKHKNDDTNRSVWHILATKGIVGLLLKLANSTGDMLGLIQSDCGRILRNITEDADARTALAKIPSEREKILELADIFIDAELEFGVRSGSKTSSFSMVNTTGVDHVSWAISNLICFTESRTAFIESDVLLTLEAVCVSTAATETSIDAASKAILALLFDVVVEKKLDEQYDDFNHYDHYDGNSKESCSTNIPSKTFETSKICCDEILGASGHVVIRGMFEEVRRQRISTNGSRRLGLALLTLIEFCQKEQENSPLEDPKEEAERKDMLSKAEIYMLKATEGDKEKLIGLSEEYSDELIEEMCKPSVLLAEDDDTQGSADLGKLLGVIQHANIQEQGFIAKFTRVASWPEIHYTAYPDVPQGMRLNRNKPKVVKPWSEPKNSGTVNSKNDSTGSKLVPLTGYNGIVLCNALDKVTPIFGAPNSINLQKIQTIAKRTNEEETKRQLSEAEKLISKNAQLQRLKEAELNMIRLRLIDEENDKKYRSQLEYKNQLHLMANATIQRATLKSTEAVNGLRKKYEFQSAHTKSAVRLKKLEDSVRSMRGNQAKSFIAEMRSQGEKSLAKTHKGIILTMGSLLQRDL